MKLLTINAHSLQEEEQEKKMECFVSFVLREKIDLIAMQEVNQTAGAPEAEPSLAEGMFRLSDQQIPLRNDNHAARTAQLLRRAGADCYWAYLPVKLGYGRFDEGAALFSIGREIAEADVLRISRTNGYADWKRRAILGIRLSGMEDWFYSVHMGWWNDSEEQFSAQWTRLQDGLREKKEAPVWLMGDFNSPVEIRGEGYDLIRAAGWHDLYDRAQEKRGRATVWGAIDGWRGRDVQGGLRIDHIFLSRPIRVRRAMTVFDGKHEMRISDHAGVFIETEQSDQEE